MWDVRNKPKTRHQTKYSESRNRGVGVDKHRGVCVCVCRMFETNPKLGNKIKANDTSLESSWFIHCEYFISKLFDAKFQLKKNVNKETECKTGTLYKRTKVPRGPLIRGLKK